MTTRSSKAGLEVRVPVGVGIRRRFEGFVEVRS
jgi:hypothetical protein